VVLPSDPTAILGETRAKNSFGLKGEAHFITERHQSNVHCLLRMGTENHVVLLSDANAILDEIRTKNGVDLKSKMPFMADPFQTKF
jgi:hypothetical protein